MGAETDYKGKKLHWLAFIFRPVHNMSQKGLATLLLSGEGGVMGK